MSDDEQVPEPETGLIMLVGPSSVPKAVLAAGLMRLLQDGFDASVKVIGDRQSVSPMINRPPTVEEAHTVHETHWVIEVVEEE